jgi:WD40 repeat protein
LDICFTPDGKLAISASEDKTLRVWNIKTGECIGVYQTISSLTVFLGSQGRFVCGDNTGNVTIMKAVIRDAGTALLSPARLKAL